MTKLDPIELELAEFRRTLLRRAQPRRVHFFEHGKLFFFHCCGKADALMDPLIDRVRIDAKHSFEDTIVPITEAKRRWGHRVALLGGLDVDFVARSGGLAARGAPSPP